MTPMQDDALPPLRQDLRIFRGAPLASGAPGWVILDPVRDRYFQIGRVVLEILKAWPAGKPAEVRARVRARTGYVASDDDIAGVRRFVEMHELADAPVGGGRALAAAALKKRHHWLAWLVHNYLFVRVPLVRPQRFLDATRAIGEVVFSPAMLAAFAVLGVIAAMLILRRWDVFAATALSFLTIDSFLAYGVSLVFVKSVHELGHAYMATRFGVRVPSMGVAFMVLAPFLYSDVSDAWRLRSRRQRLAIGAAGMLAEAMLAIIALLAWVFLPDGPLRSTAFVTGTTSLVASIVLNLNPFMRFDGYHLLADATGIPNLQARAMAIGRWRLREFLWGLGAPPPEPFGPTARRVLALYAYAIWIYRFFLFLGIAILVYHMAFKALGIILFLIEIVWFILRPIWSELKVQWAGRHEIRRRPRSLVTLGLLGLCLVAFFVPLNGRVDFGALATASTDAAIYPRSAGRIERIAVREGERVRAGDVLIELRSPDLEAEITRSELKLALIEQRYARAAADAAERAEHLVLLGQRDAEQRRLEGLREQAADLVIRAPHDGAIRDLDPALRTGLWVGVRTLVGRVIDGAGGEVRGLVEEADLRRVRAGAAGRFIPEDPMSPAVDVRIVALGVTALDDLDLLPLASIHEGPIPVAEDSKRRLKPTVAVYPVRLAAANASTLTTSLRGRVFVAGEPESMAARVTRRVIGVLIRESGA